jgi:hypothetical protein
MTKLPLGCVNEGLRGLPLRTSTIQELLLRLRLVLVDFRVRAFRDSS